MSAKRKTLPPFQVEAFYELDRRGRRSVRKDNALRKAAGSENGGSRNKQSGKASLTWSFSRSDLASAMIRLLDIPFVIHVDTYQIHSES